MSESSSSGVSFFGLLFLLFLGLKLTNYIDWSWVWIFAPLWFPIIFYLIIVGIAFLLIWLKYGLT